MGLLLLTGVGAATLSGKTSDSFTLPGRDVETLAVPIDGPWLKLSEAVDYVRAVAPSTYVPIHEGELTDVAKYVGMLAAFAGPSGRVPHAAP